LKFLDVVGVPNQVEERRIPPDESIGRGGGQNRGSIAAERLDRRNLKGLGRLDVLGTETSRRRCDREHQGGVNQGTPAHGGHAGV
jgi:hypothetical protein